MDQTSPAGNPTVQSAADLPMPPATADAVVLREELAKWRERVPKLASALRQRADEADALRKELERLRARAAEDAARNDASTTSAQPAPAESVPAGIHARDTLIAELEGKVADLAERHKRAQGDLHTQQMSIDELRAESEGWKRKWQDMTRSLDDEASRFTERNREADALQTQVATLTRQLDALRATETAARRSMEEAIAERDSLERRNEQLFETTEVANRQIGSLSDSMTELRASLKALRERDAAAAEAQAALQAERQTLQQQCADLGSRAERAEQTLTSERAAAETARAERQRELGESRQARDAAGEALALAQAALEDERRRAAAAEQGVTALVEELHLLSTAAAFGFEATAAAEAHLGQARRDTETAQARAAEAEARLADRDAELVLEREETARLTEVVASAQAANDSRERERRELSERLQTMASRALRLEEQLEERSALVVNLEQQQADATRREGALERQRDELEESLIRAERHVKENAEHVAGLDAKLERQKELMDNLEAELAEVGQEHAEALKSHHAESAAEAERLRNQVRKLERLVRERTEELNQRDWQQSLLAGNATADAAPHEPGAGTPETDSAAANAQPDADDKADGDAQATADSRMLLVLNQQLADARTRNEDLLARLRELEKDAGQRSAGGSELTRIHGIGHKLAEQLNDLGIFDLRQIAEIDPAELEDEGHVLHGHRARILRDGWVDQAVRLISH